MVERGADHRLALEAQHPAGIAAAVHAFQRDGTAEDDVLGQRHRGHSADAESPDLAIAGRLFGIRHPSGLPVGPPIDSPWVATRLGGADL
jgi:hypothetical protein